MPEQFPGLDLGAGDYKPGSDDDDILGLSKFTSKPSPKPYQPFGGPMQQQPQSYAQPQSYEPAQNFSEPSYNVFSDDELDTYERAKKDYSYVNNYATSAGQIASKRKSSYDDFMKSKLTPYFESVGGFGDFEDDDELASAIDEMEASALKTSQQDDGFFGPSKEKIAAGDSLNNFKLWSSPNGLRDQYRRLRSERDQYQGISDTYKNEKIRRLEQLTNIPIPAKQALDEALKSRGKSSGNKPSARKASELLNSVQFEEQAYTGAGLSNQDKTDPRSAILFDDIHGTAKKRQSERMRAASRGDIKGVLSRRQHIAKERQLRDKGFFFSESGLLDGRPIGMSRRDVDLLDIDDMRKAGMTSFQGKPLDQAMTDLGGEERLEMAKVMQSVYSTKSNYEDAQLKFLKAAGSPKADKLRDAMEAAREDMQKTIGLAASYGLDNELFEQAETTGWLSAMGNAVQRGALMSEMSNYTPDFLTNTLDADEMQRFIEIASEIEKLPTSSTMKRVKETKSDGFLDAMGNLLFDNPAAIPEMFVESLSSFLPSTIKWLLPSAAAGAAAGTIVAPGAGTAAGAAIGARASWGVASFVLEASGMALEGMQELNIDWKNPKVFAAAWTNESIRSKIQKKMVQKGTPIAIADMLTGAMAGKVMGVVNHTGNAVFKGGKLLNKEAFNKASGAVPRFTLMQKTRNAAAELGADSTMGMGGEYLGQWASKEPGEDWDWDAIAAEGLVGVGPGAVGAALEMRGPRANYFGNAPIEVGSEEQTETGTRGVVTRAGYSAPFQTFSSPEAMGDYLSTLPNTNPEAVEFTKGWISELYGMNGKEMGNLKIAISPRTPDANPRNRGTFESRDGQKIIYLNEEEFASDPMATFMHEAGHMARVITMDDKKLMDVWKTIGEDAQKDAYAQYFTKRPGIKLSDLDPATQKKVESSFKKTDDDILAEEWFSYQFAQFIMGKNSQVEPDVQGALQTYKEKLGDTYAQYAGTDAKGKELFGQIYAMLNLGPLPEDTQTAEPTSSGPKTDKDLQSNLNAMPGKPADKVKIAKTLNAMAGEKILSTDPSFYTNMERGSLKAAGADIEERDKESGKTEKQGEEQVDKTPEWVDEMNNPKEVDISKLEKSSKDKKKDELRKAIPKVNTPGISKEQKASARKKVDELKKSIDQEDEKVDRELSFQARASRMTKLDSIIPKSKGDRVQLTQGVNAAKNAFPDIETLDRKLDAAMDELGPEASSGQIISKLLNLDELTKLAPRSFTKEMRKLLQESRGKLASNEDIEDVSFEITDEILDIKEQLRTRVDEIDKQIASLQKGASQKPKAASQKPEAGETTVAAEIDALKNARKLVKTYLEAVAPEELSIEWKDIPAHAISYASNGKKYSAEPMTLGQLADRRDGFKKGQLYYKNSKGELVEAKNESRTGQEILWDHISKFDIEQTGKTTDFGYTKDGELIKARKYELILEAVKASAYFRKSAAPKKDGGVGADPMGVARFEKTGQGQSSPKGYARKDPQGFEVSSTANTNIGKAFSAFNAKLSDGKSIEYHYQVNVKGYPSIKAGKGKPPLLPATEIRKGGGFFEEIYEQVKSNPRASEIKKRHDQIEAQVKAISDPGEQATLRQALDRSYMELYELLPTKSERKINKNLDSYGEYKKLWERFAKENPKKIKALKKAAAGRVLTDRYATTEVNQARALYEILAEPSNREAQKGYPAGYQSNKGTNYAALIASRLGILNSMKPLSNDPSPSEILALKMANGRALELLGDPTETERDFNKAIYIALLEELGVEQSGMLSDPVLVEERDYAETEEYTRGALEKISNGTPVVAAIAGIPSTSKRQAFQRQVRDDDAASAQTEIVESKKMDRPDETNPVWEEYGKKGQEKAAPEIKRKGTSEVVLNINGLKVPSARAYKARRPDEDLDKPVPETEQHQSFTRGKVYETFDVVTSFAEGRTKREVAKFNKNRTNIQKSEELPTNPISIERENADLLSTTDINAAEFAEWYMSGKPESQMEDLQLVPSSKNNQQAKGGLGEGFLPYVFLDFARAMYKKLGLIGIAAETMEQAREAEKAAAKSEKGKYSNFKWNLEQGALLENGKINPKQKIFTKPADRMTPVGMAIIAKPIVQAVIDARGVDIYNQIDRSASVLLQRDIDRAEQEGSRESLQDGAFVERGEEMQELGAVTQDIFNPDSETLSQEDAKKGVVSAAEKALDENPDVLKNKDSVSDELLEELYYSSTSNDLTNAAEKELQRRGIKALYVVREETADQLNKIFNSDAEKQVDNFLKTVNSVIFSKTKSKTLNSDIGTPVGNNLTVALKVMSLVNKGTPLSKILQLGARWDSEDIKNIYNGFNAIKSIEKVPLDQSPNNLAKQLLDYANKRRGVRVKEKTSENTSSTNLLESIKSSSSWGTLSKLIDQSIQEKEHPREFFDYLEVEDLVEAVASEIGSSYFTVRDKLSELFIKPKTSTVSKESPILSAIEKIKAGTPAFLNKDDLQTFLENQKSKIPKQSDENINWLYQKALAESKPSSKQIDQINAYLKDRFSGISMSFEKESGGAAGRFLGSRMAIDPFKIKKASELMSSSSKVSFGDFENLGGVVRDESGVLAFVALHEMAHGYVFQDKNQSLQDYENLVNAAALLKMFRSEAVPTPDRTLNSDAKILTSDADPNLAKATLLGRIAGDSELIKEFKEWAGGKKQSLSKGSLKMDLVDRADPLNQLNKLFLKGFEAVGLDSSNPLYKALNVHGKYYQFFGEGDNSVEQARLEYYEPMMELMREYNVDEKKIGEYLNARAAPSRNLQIEAKALEALKEMEKDPEGPKSEKYKKIEKFFFNTTEDGKRTIKRDSGISTETALKVVAEMEKEPRFVEFLDKFLVKYYKMNREGLSTLAGAGMIQQDVSSKEGVNEVEAMRKAMSRFDFRGGKADKYGNKYKSKVSALEDNYSYSPLQGFEGETENFYDQEAAWEEFGAGSNATGKGFDQKKSDLILQGAFGRYKSGAPDPSLTLGNSFRQHISSAILAQKNGVAQKFGAVYGMMRSIIYDKDGNEHFNANRLTEEEKNDPIYQAYEELIKLKEPGNETAFKNLKSEFDQIFDPKGFEESETVTQYELHQTGEIGIVRREMSQKFKNDPTAFTYRRDGAPQFIKFTSKSEGLRMADTMKNLRYENLPQILQGFNTVTRGMAQMFTSANPAFILPNFFRDVATAAIHLSEDDKKVLIKDASELQES